jgi:LytTr DNA-binding domain
MGKWMRRRTFDLLAVAGVFAAYSITIGLALHLDLRKSMLGGVANTVPVVIFGALVRRIILRGLMGKHGAVQLAAHLLLCAAFVCLSYGLLIVLLGLFNGQKPAGFLVESFSASGMAWQSLENVTTYALIAAVSYLQGLRELTATPPSRAIAAGEGVKGITQASAMYAPKAMAGQDQADALVVTPLTDAAGEDPETRADAALSRYFVRIGDELRPIDIDTVVSIGGADDYTEVTTLSGKHLVRVTLAEFAKSLDPAKYVRVHRSWIVNVHRIAHAEPAGGGRLLLHMETGQTISTSRTGAKLLRDRVI